jgi:tryptophan-rich sensory protein
MNLMRPVVWLLVVVWLVAFGCLAVASVQAVASGDSFEYRLYDVQFPFVAFALLACMAASSGLLWFNNRGVDFSGAEETIYGALFGVSVFGLMLSLLLALMA